MDAIWQQTITLTNVDFWLVRFCGIRLRAIHRETKVLHFHSNFIEIHSWEGEWQYVSISLGNGLALNR